MRKDDVTTPGAALAYLLDCTMATVCDMAAKKSRTKGEFQRQILIAQAGADWAREFGVDVSKTRALELPLYGHSVAAWASKFYPQQ